MNIIYDVEKESTRSLAEIEINGVNSEVLSSSEL